MFEDFDRRSWQPGTEDDWDVIEFITEDEAALVAEHNIWL